MNVVEWAKEHQTPLLIGGGGIVLFLILRNRPAAVAATAPVEGAPTLSGTAPPAAQPELNATAQQAQALQQQYAQQQLSQQQAAFNLSLMGAHQQLQFEGQQQQEQLLQQSRMDEQQYYLAQQYGKMAHQQLRNMTPPGGFLGSLQKIGQTATALVAPVTAAFNLYGGISGGSSFTPLPMGGVAQAPRPVQQPQVRVPIPQAQPAAPQSFPTFTPTFA